MGKMDNIVSLISYSYNAPQNSYGETIMRLFNRIGLFFAFSFVATGSYVWAANFNPLPDTGQTSCYDADGNEILCPAEGEPFYGQDGNYQVSAPSFTDNGNGTVTDNNTGLVWQKNTADTNEDGSITSGDYPVGDKMTWQEAVDYCDGLVFSGRDNWYLPRVLELESLVDYGDTGINSIFTIVSGVSFYWTSDSPQGTSALAWYVSFPTGHNYWPSKASHYYVRCATE